MYLDIRNADEGAFRVSRAFACYQEKFELYVACKEVKKNIFAGEVKQLSDINCILDETQSFQICILTDIADIVILQTTT